MQTFQKNLEYIKKQNVGLYQKLQTMTQVSKAFDIKQNLIGEYNLLIDAKPVHSITNIEEESQNLFNAVQNDSLTSIHFIYGLGLGYVPDKFLEKLKGKIVVYEQDLETLFIVLSAVDFSQNFETERFFIVSDFSETDKILEQLFKYKSEVSISYLDYYKYYQKSALETFQEQLTKKVEMVNHNYSFQVKTNFNFFSQTINNISEKYNYPLISEYKDVFKNIPAIIVSAGPSLHKNIESLKKYHNNALIFCGGTSLKTCCNNGITPNFLNVIERRNTLVHYDLPQTKDMNIIVEPFTESSYLNKDFNNILYTASLESDDARWYLETGNKKLTPFETKGTVAYHSIYTAYYLGCNPIILIGQDLAYSGGECYAKGSNFDGLSCIFDNETNNYKVVFTNEEKFREAYFRAHQNLSETQRDTIIERRITELNTNLRTVSGQNGEKLPTDAVYALFLEYIQDFAKQHKDERTLINCSIGGALIKGFKTMSLDDAFKEMPTQKLNKNEIINNAKFSPTFNKKTVLQNLKNDYNIIKEVISKLEKGKNLSINLEKDLISDNKINTSASNLTRKLSTLFLDITTNYMLKKRIIKIILFKEYMELDYLTRIHPTCVTLDDAKEFLTGYNEYFDKGLGKAKKILEQLKINIDRMENK